MKLRAHYARVQQFSKTEDGNYVPMDYKWMKVRSNAAIPDSHKMFK